MLMSESRYRLAGLFIAVCAVGLLVVAAAVFISRRQARIEKVKEQIQTELDQLDPVARAQVLASVADEEYGILDRLQND